jgi:hypothetical protein
MTVAVAALCYSQPIFSVPGGIAASRPHGIMSACQRLAIVLAPNPTVVGNLVAILSPVIQMLDEAPAMICLLLDMP